MGQGDGGKLRDAMCRTGSFGRITGGLTGVNNWGETLKRVIISLVNLLLL